MRTRFVHAGSRALLAFGLGTAVLAAAIPSSAAEAPVGLGTAGSYAVLAGSTITNTGTSVISGDVGLHPGSAIVGLPSAMVTNGTIHAADAAAAQAQADAATGYDDAAARSSAATVLDLGGRLLVPGVYTATTALGLTGTVTLDAGGDPDAVFVFQAGTTLTTASASTVALVNGASPCNVFWQIGSSATLGTDSSFVGTLLALQSVAATTRATVEGRLLARNGAVTLDANTITAPLCVASTAPTTSTTAATSSPTTVATNGSTVEGGPAATSTGTGTGTGTGTAPPAAASPTTPTTATGRPTTSGGATSTAASRPGAPPLAHTGTDRGLIVVALVLLALGSLLAWTGRTPLAHAPTWVRS